MLRNRQIIVREGGHEIVLRDSGSRKVIVRGNERLRIVEIARQGPPGASGQNADSSFEWATQTFNLSSPQQEFALDFVPRTGSVFVFLNGLLERFWSIADSTIILTESALTGDTVSVSYQKEN